MVYLTISLRNSPENEKSPEVENALDALMKTTTDCAIIYEPEYDDFEDLFKSAYKGDTCFNLGQTALEYLNDTSRLVLASMMASEATVKAYELQFFEQDGAAGILKFVTGSCSGNLNSAQRTIVSSPNNLIVKLKTCS